MIKVGIYNLETKPDLSIPEHIRKWRRGLKLDCWTGVYRNPDGSHIILLHCDADVSNIEEVLNHEIIHVIMIRILKRESSFGFDRYWCNHYRHEGEIPEGIKEFLKGLSYCGIGFS